MEPSFWGLVVTVSLAFVVACNCQFIRRSGTYLTFDNGDKFTFSGGNAYWLGLDENVDGVNYPTNFRVDDAMATFNELGSRVVRAHTVGVSTGNSKSVETSLSNWNDVALGYIDYAVYSAKQAGIYLVVPLTDNYHYYHGGKHDFSDWRGLDESTFYTDTQVINDFLEYIDNLLYHVNNYTGVRLMDEPAIMSWETGNELSPPANWTKLIADHIKSIDKNHLVMDGTYGINSDALSISSVEIYSDHFYPMEVSKLNRDASQVYAANKVYFVGEYGWSQGDLESFLTAIETNVGNGKLCGDNFWSLFPHADNYGFVQHSDGFTLHYPGDTTDMQSRVTMLRNHAFKVSAQSVPSHNIPPAPIITSASSASRTIAWRGAAAASSYDVERSSTSPSFSSPAADWQVVCSQCADDNDTPWYDSSRTQSADVWYRVRGYNLDGVPGDYSPSFFSSSSS
ncbi:cellulase family glycosylhydrolase [Pelomyxa schiedti]|nr:cellulase family glycosylhydrolase [Pelomyxa schiedti]